MGQAIKRRMDERSGVVTFPAPTTKGCYIPSIIAPGQNERVMLWPVERTLLNEDQEIDGPSIRVREGVSHGSERRPF